MLTTLCPCGPGPHPPEAGGETSTNVPARVVRGASRLACLVVGLLPVGGPGEVGEVQPHALATSFAVLLIASFCAWYAAGRVPAQARVLTWMARTESTSHVAPRIEARDRGRTVEPEGTLDPMLDRLEDVIRGQQELVRHTTHELRDALTIIGGHVELLGDDPEERRQMVGVVLEEVSHMARIVHELQLLTDAQEPDFLRLERLELATLAQAVLEEASYLAPRRWQLDPVAAGTVVADRLRLREAMLDLAHNALQSTGENDTVAIGGSMDHEEVRIWVRDTGRGIASPDQVGIFERFARRSGGERGTGLGLAVVKAIVEAHGGRVELESSVDAGSTFTIVLPRRLEAGAARRKAS